MFEFRRLYCAHAQLHAPFPFDGLLMKQTMEFLCKANGAILHYVLASFVLSTLSELSFIAGKAFS